MRILLRLKAGLDAVDHDAEHILAKYGQDAPAFCETALANTLDPFARLKLRLVLRAVRARSMRAASIACRSDLILPM